MRLILPMMAVLLLAPLAPHAAKAERYDRSAFGAWTIEGCLNTRARLLQLMHIGTAKLTVDKCRVVRGKWSSFYSSQTFTDAGDVEIDHLIPLAWAWRRGAKDWSRAKRVRFANDTRYLTVSSKPLNRAKSDKTPLEWMPPDARVRCRYISRFVRGASEYRLRLTPREASGLARKGRAICGGRFVMPQSLGS